MDYGQIATAAAVIGGPILVWLVKIEHRLTRLETTIIERLPPRSKHVSE
jgi:hypothetical protein